MTTSSGASSVLERGHLRIRELIAGLPAEHLRTTGIGGGEWSPKDLVGHLALWHEIAVRTIGEQRRGQRPWVVDVFGAPGPGPNDEELAKRAGWSPGHARAVYDRSFAQVLAAIEGLSDDEWSSPVDGWAMEPADLGGLLGVVLGKDELPFGHAFAHIPDLETFVEMYGTHPTSP